MSLKNLPNENNVYETERLMIQKISVDDKEFVFELYNRPKFIKYIGDRGINTISDAENYIKNRFLPQFDRLGFGNYLILTKDKGEKIGAVGIFEREGLDVVDIGFSLLEEFEGKGYAFEAAQKVKSIGMDIFGLHKISAITTKDNFSSQNLIVKLGLSFKNYVTIPDDEEELMYYETE
ncbi:GNAT family N-acetyltransferase [Chryseobacterium carnipullorum]|uniref:GNAT family N-acetyltransferase n=1 Tax=Chryseobacterium carnipullorum TaxID=1124835 RepID=UPI000917B834|nr:GNAT family N-acetyltransferase [Chryseobacterium carnipullorum]MDN5394980.1 GNAT family N-acetyltransferase [Chryseobacterium sp.]MDN5422259.1 GNAT family N-acetyltransferase [Chryseobacterium sp.]MDN5476101.1 GNAT family N-acetyltransferase [Chryseobacterium sp.]MDN5480064.1 GNAT family N-acetyltransferase [Chryseobacterium sp.]SHL31493.1 Protein N-acetyltransferase, RimJ/RimL family [Chryseobacterium carnipullorum]